MHPRLAKRLAAGENRAMHALLAGSLLTFASQPAQAQPAAADAAVYADEYHEPLRGNPAAKFDFILSGPDAARLVQFQPEGLRITLPTGYPDQRPSTGVLRRTPVHGDFEITVSFEILREPETAQAGKQTKLGLAVLLN